MRSIILLLILFSETSLCGFEQKETGARSGGLCNAFSALAGDAYAVFFNPAGLASVRNVGLSLSYVPARYGFPELSRGSVLASIPTHFGSFAVGLGRYGFDLYREVHGVLTYANSIDRVDAGINLNFYSVSIQNYGSSASVGIDAGLLITIVDELRCGLVINNINAPTIGSTSEKIPQSFTMGIAYSPSNDLTLVADIYKEQRFELSQRLGIEYWLTKNFALRTGIATEPSEYAGGIGVRLSSFQFDYAFTIHHGLGGTHALTFTFCPGGYND